MKTRGLSMILTSLALLGCAGGAIAQRDVKNDVSAKNDQMHVLPGLPGASGSALQGGQYIPLPEPLSQMLSAIRCSPLSASKARKGNPYVVQLATTHATPEYLATDEQGPYFHYWIRSFSGTERGVTGYLVQVTGCIESKKNQYGLHAYRVVEGQAPEDITSSILDPDALLGSKAVKRYMTLGASGFFADTSRLAEVPVLRWIMEADPDRGLPDNDPQVFDSGALLHGGFVVWNGERFESRKTVPAALWPCPAEKPSLCPEDDRFVIRQP